MKLVYERSTCECLDFRRVDVPWAIEFDGGASIHNTTEQNRQRNEKNALILQGGA